MSQPCGGEPKKGRRQMRAETAAAVVTGGTRRGWVNPAVQCQPWRGAPPWPEAGELAPWEGPRAHRRGWRNTSAAWGLGV